MNSLQVITSFKKEIWEFKKTLFWVPTIIAICIIVAPILRLLLLDDWHISEIIEALTHAENGVHIEGIARFFLASLMGMFIPFIAVALVIQLYYFTACLFDERRDLSIYFWRSLPVSDVMTLSVKLVTGALVVPAIFMLAASAVVAIFLLFAFITCIVLSMGFDISLWELWGSAEIFSNLGSVWLNLFPYALWMFPLYAWLMLASMFANKAPFLWAILPIAALLLIESYIVEYLHLDSRFLLETLGGYFTFGQELLPNDISNVESPKLLLLTTLSSKVSLVATLIGCGLMYLTYWLRVNRSQG